MKIKAFFAVAMLALTGAGFSASYTLTNVNGATLTDSNGFADGLNALTNTTGSVAFGRFNVTDTQLQAISSNSELLAAFSGFGGSSTGNFTAPGFTGAKGTFSRNSTGLVADSAFAGSFIYILVGNAATLAASTEFAVLKTTHTFNASDDSVSTPITLVVNQNNSTLLIGEQLGDVRVSNGDQSTTPGWGTVAVPEPSAALLGLLGAIGLIRRRR